MQRPAQAISTVIGDGSWLDGVVFGGHGRSGHARATMHHTTGKHVRTRGG